MHELALTEGILEIVRAEAEKNGFSRVLEITLRVGAFSGIGGPDRPAEGGVADGDERGRLEGRSPDEHPVAARVVEPLRQGGPDGMESAENARGHQRDAGGETETAPESGRVA